MGLISLTCPNCGGNLQVEEGRDEYFCNYCGARVIREKQYVEVSGTVNVDGIATVDSIVERAFMEISDGNFSKADSLLDKALTAAPQKWNAHLGKLLCKLNLKSVDELINADKSLTEFEDFNRAVSYAPAEEKEKINRLNLEVNSKLKAENDSWHKTLKAAIIFVGVMVALAILVILFGYFLS